MRIVKEIPHPVFKITIFQQNNRFSLKISGKRHELTYKFRDGTFSAEELEKKAGRSFLLRIEEVFKEMQEIRDLFFRLPSHGESDEEFEEII